MSDPISLSRIFSLMFGQDFMIFLVLAFLIVLFPYVVGYYSKTQQREYFKTEIIFRIVSLLVSVPVAVFFVQLYMPLPADWQENQIILILVNITSMAVGIILWKASYTIGQDRAATNAVDRQDLTRIIVEEDIKPAIGDAVNKVANELTSKNSSFEKVFSS